MTTTATVSYNGDGSSNLWTVPFAYLKKSHVKLVVDGVEDTTFTWVTDSSIAATTTPPVGTNNVTISRQTPRSALDTTIPASGTFRGADINNQSLQALYVAEEGYDALVNILSLDTADSKWDAESKVIKNLAAPGSDNDAARKVDVDTVAGSASAAAASASAAATSASAASSSASAASTSASNALASENAAATSETNAATSETNAATSASNASTSASNASTSASNASTSETNAASSASAASTSASNAAASESAAATSASNASTSATNAATEVTYAAEWANKAENSLISAAADGDQVDDYSALHWANKASASATAAATSAGAVGGAFTPGGRLTATSGDRWNSTGVSAGTAIYYTPVFHGYVPLYDGSDWTASAFTELTNTFSDATKNPAATTANKNYDLFIWNDSGTVRLSRGPAWTSDTARSAGTALTTVNGRQVNNTAITNGPLANRGLYVGSFRTNGSNQLEAERKVNGGTLNFLLWNLYNQLQIVLVNDFSGGSHTYGTNSTRRFAGDGATDIGVIQGLGTAGVHGRADITSGHGGTQRGTFGMGVSANTVTLVGAYADTDGGTHTSTFLGYLSVPMGFQTLRTLETAPTGSYTAYRSDSKSTAWWIA